MNPVKKLLTYLCIPSLISTKILTRKYKKHVANVEKMLNPEPYCNDMEIIYKKLAPDGTPSSTIEISPKNNQDVLHENQKYLIVFCGILDYYELFLKRKDFLLLARDYKCKVRFFNYRGVGQNEGEICSLNDIVDDGLKKVLHLIKVEKVNPKNITLYGLCTGGYFATLAASRLHKMGYRVKLFADRAPFKLYTAIKSIKNTFNEWSNYLFPIKFISKLLSDLLNLISFLVFSINGFNIDITNAYREIPEEYKFKTRVINDQTVTSDISLDKAFKEDREKQRRLDPHLYKIIKQKHKDEKFVAYTKSLKKITSMTAHVCPLQSLKNTHKGDSSTALDRLKKLIQLDNEPSITN